jgi:hypothetical protein
VVAVKGPGFLAFAVSVLASCSGKEGTGSGEKSAFGLTPVRITISTIAFFAEPIETLITKTSSWDDSLKFSHNI